MTKRYCDFCNTELIDAWPHRETVIRFDENKRGQPGLDASVTLHHKDICPKCIDDQVVQLTARLSGWVTKHKSEMKEVRDAIRQNNRRVDDNG